MGVGTYDIIIVGGGSAGCVLAGRLSEDPSCHVLLIEAGRDDRPGHEPAHIRDTLFVAPYQPENVWPGLLVQWTRPRTDEEQRPPQPYIQARVIGGGSSINAMAAPRGMPDDYEEWNRLGADGWGWRDVLPWFVRLESDADFAGPEHGRDGPLPIRRIPREDWPPFVRAVAGTLEQQGLPHVADMNTDFRDGVCSLPMTRTESARATTAMAYLGDAVRARPNLAILANTTVERIVFNGTRAIAVETRAPAGALAFDGGEIVLAAGALQSPVLLLRSGIGAAKELEAAGVRTIVDLPGVGRNLHDHPAVAVAGFLRRSARQAAALRPATSIIVRATSECPEAVRADLFMGAPNKVAWHPFGQRLAAINVAVNRPESRGAVRLTRGAMPELDFNLLGEPADLARLRAGFRRACKTMECPAVRELLLATFPVAFSRRVARANRYGVWNWLQSAALTGVLDLTGPLRLDVIRRLVSAAPPLAELLQNERQLDRWIRRSVAGFFHPVGTCRMGAPRDPQAVVDPTGRVYGVEGLRIVDASVMPRIVRANTNLTTIMIAERLAATIRDSTPQRAASITGVT